MTTRRQYTRRRPWRSPEARRTIQVSFDRLHLLSTSLALRSARSALLQQAVRHPDLMGKFKLMHERGQILKTEKMLMSAAQTGL